jgi:acyl carrier protein
MSMEGHDRLLSLIATALEVPEESLDTGMAIADIEAWDSFGWLAIMGAIDAHLRMTITPAEASRCRTVGDFLAYVDGLVSARQP